MMKRNILVVPALISAILAFYAIGYYDLVSFVFFGAIAVILLRIAFPSSTKEYQELRYHSPLANDTGYQKSRITSQTPEYTRRIEQDRLRNIAG